MPESSIHIDHFEALARLTCSQKAEPRDFSVTMEELIQTVVDTLKVESVNVWLINKEKNQIECIAHRQNQSAKDFVFNLIKNDTIPIYLEHLQASTLLVSENTLEDERFVELYSSYFEPNNVRASIDVPIYIEGELKAILCCNHTQTTRIWKISEQQFALAVGNIVALLLEIWEHRKAKQKLLYHDKLLRGINSCMFQLFSSIDFFDGLDAITRTIGKTTDSDRVFIFQIFLDENQKEYYKIIKEWTSNEGFKQIDESEGEDRKHCQATLTYWKDRLRAGESLHTIKDQLTDEEQCHFWSEKGQSALVVPIFVNEKEFWGGIGLEDCKSKREWTITEESSIFNLAIAIGGLLTKKHIENLHREQNIQLQKTNEELDQFVYSVSHDIRSPLISAKTLLEMIRKAPDDNLNFYLDLVHQSISRLDRYVLEVLSIFRNKRTEICTEQIDIAQIVEEIKKNLAYLEEAKHVLISLEINNPNNLPFYGDRVRLRIILDNLISNAIRYHNPYQEQSRVIIAVNIQEKDVIIIVRDNGLGIEAKHLPHIFEMFYRANNITSGSGLGLYIVKEVVKKMEGAIQVHSVANEGTSFFIQLPNHYKKNETSSSISPKNK